MKLLSTKEPAMPINSEFVTKKIANQLEYRLRAVEYEQSKHFVELRKLCVDMQKEIEQTKHELDNLRRRILAVESHACAPAPAPTRARARKSVLDGLTLR